MKTKPKDRGINSRTDGSLLVAGRYGTKEMIEIFGPENYVKYALIAQAKAAKTLSTIDSQLVPKEDADEIEDNLDKVSYQRVREIEDEINHDLIAINRALGEKISHKAASHINKGRTSADTTETAKALQIKKAIEILIDSVENLRDIIIEKSEEWKDVPHMDTTHLYDALPTVAGRPFSFFAEMIQSTLDMLRYTYENSIYGKWADATGNHHSISVYKIDGLRLQEEYCKSLGIKNMVANSQIPGREFICDVIYAIVRLAENMNNVAKYVAWCRSDDVNIFVNNSPSKNKGSSAMPHKDAKNGNPIIEEQTESYANKMRGMMSGYLSSCSFKYARDLSGSALDRIDLKDAFVWGDHIVRRLAYQVYYLKLLEENSIGRVNRTYGIVSSQRVMSALTSTKYVKEPMTREEAHDFMGELATQAYSNKKNFTDVLLENKKVTDMLSEKQIRELSNPHTYIGYSKEIIEKVKKDCYKKKTL